MHQAKATPSLQVVQEGDQPPLTPLAKSPLPAAEASNQASILRSGLQTVLTEQCLSQADAAKRIGCGATALSRWLNGKYTGDNAALEAKVCQWLEDQACQTAFLPSEGADWIETPTARQIGMAIAYAHLSRDIAVVCGGAGVGKTITAQHYAQTRPNCWVCTMVPSFASAPACLKALLFALAPSQRADGRGGDVVYRMLLSLSLKKRRPADYRRGTAPHPPRLGMPTRFARCHCLRPGVHGQRERLHPDERPALGRVCPVV